jgi:hypothetical protein
MVDQLFRNEDLRERLLAGPMGPYLDVLASRLLELGYCHSQARKLVRTASALGLWLAERGLIATGRPFIRFGILSSYRDCADGTKKAWMSNAGLHIWLHISDTLTSEKHIGT